MGQRRDSKRVEKQPIEIQPDLAVIARLVAEMTAPNRHEVEEIRIHRSSPVEAKRVSFR